MNTEHVEATFMSNSFSGGSVFKPVTDDNIRYYEFHELAHDDTFANVFETFADVCREDMSAALKAENEPDRIFGTVQKPSIYIRTAFFLEDDEVKTVEYGYSLDGFFNLWGEFGGVACFVDASEGFDVWTRFINKLVSKFSEKLKAVQITANITLVGSEFNKMINTSVLIS